LSRRSSSERGCLSLELLEDGLYRYQLRRPRAGATRAFLFEPLELVENLAALIPIPRVNLIRYHGVLAPASSWRSAVVPKLEDEKNPLCPRCRPGVPSDRVPWAWLLLRVFLVEVLRCDRCGGRRDVLAIMGPVAVPRILAHLGLPTTGPQPDGARAPPQTDWLAS